VIPSFVINNGIRHIWRQFQNRLTDFRPGTDGLKVSRFHLKIKRDDPRALAGQTALRTQTLSRLPRPSPAPLFPRTTAFCYLSLPMRWTASSRRPPFTASDFEAGVPGTTHSPHFSVSHRTTAPV